MCCVALRGLGKLGVCGRGGSVVGFLGLSCVFALAWVLSGGLGFPGGNLPETGIPAKAKALFVLAAGVLSLGSVLMCSFVGHLNRESQA